MQELHLKGNCLTVNALVELAKVIHLSSRDLKELDISNNEISIRTISDAHKWKFFLHSFAQCCVLKKIDFSGNALGTRGIEVLARVYIRSELDFVEAVDLEDDNENATEDALEHGAGTVGAGQATKAARRGKSYSPQ